ncbi:hypothetical protein PAHAL_4G259000 [Panicum hallii]|jgi:hypothetical protein|uniref:Uncharacterized protein n=1 Tax=Panicum hallii TaxID=206008 RepID=A0A2S3HKG3_9POAL|nr:hypothetical protein PAHAL_4G259000 [Panicum hallii]
MRWLIEQGKRRDRWKMAGCCLACFGGGKFRKGREKSEMQLLVVVAAERKSEGNQMERGEQVCRIGEGNNCGCLDLELHVVSSSDWRSQRSERKSDRAAVLCSHGRSTTVAGLSRQSRHIGVTPSSRPVQRRSWRGANRTSATGLRYESPGHCFACRSSSRRLARSSWQPSARVAVAFSQVTSTAAGAEAGD